MTKPPEKFVPVPDSAGNFPPLPDQVAPLLSITQAETATAMCVDFRDITAFDGQFGTGKTTAATLAVNAVGGVTWKYCVPPQQTTTKGAMVTLYEAVFGYGGPMNEREATSALATRLSEGDLGVAIDEVHHTGLLGMQAYRHLWDLTAVKDRPFPLLLIGCNVRETLHNAGEVRSRVGRWVLFDTIQHPDDLTTLTENLHPRLKATKENVLVTLNEDVIAGDIRTWYQFAKHIDYLPSTTATGKPKPLTRDDIRRLRNLTGI